MLNTLIALPYELARLPLTVVDSALSDRMPETSGPRVTLDRALGSADKLAGSLLRNPDIARRGTERIERSDKLLTAARLEQEAARRREQAKETAGSGRQEAARKRKAAQERVTSGLKEADEVEARGKKAAEEAADRAAATKKAAADRRAAEKAAAIERQEQQVAAAAETKKQAAQRKPQSELDDARERKQAAKGARDDAERLEELVDTKKQERQQD